MISLSAILIIWGVRGDTYTHEMITRCGLATTFAAVILLLACPISIFSWICAGGRHEAHFGTARERILAKVIRQARPTGGAGKIFLEVRAGQDRIGL